MGAIVIGTDSADAESLKVDFKGAMRRLASGVAIIVAKGEDGPVGMAATSITSLTMDPPAVLVCVNRSAGIHACLAPGKPVGVNLLSRGQKEVSMAFSGAVARELRFGVGHWDVDARGYPVLAGAQANLDCVIDSLISYGTHSIAIARVEAVRLSDAFDPLVYQDGGYV